MSFAADRDRCFDALFSVVYAQGLRGKPRVRISSEQRCGISQIHPLMFLSWISQDSVLSRESSHLIIIRIAGRD